MEQTESLAAAQGLNFVKGGYNSYEQLLQLNGNYFSDCLTSTSHHVTQNRPSGRSHLGHIISDKDPGGGGGSYENNNELSPTI